MSPEETELAFRPDFAARVLVAADAFVVRRRRLRWGAAATVVLAGVVAIGVLRPTTAVQPGPLSVAAFDLGVSTDDAQTEPTDYMFPDAASLTQFADSYSGTDDTSDDTIFAETEDDTDS